MDSGGRDDTTPFGGDGCFGGLGLTVPRQRPMAYGGWTNVERLPRASYSDLERSDGGKYNCFPLFSPPSRDQTSSWSICNFVSYRWLLKDTRTVKLLAETRWPMLLDQDHLSLYGLLAHVSSFFTGHSDCLRMRKKGLTSMIDRA